MMMGKEDLKNSDDDVFMFEADDSLRQLIGHEIDLKKVFSPEKIKACQQIIDDARDEFFGEEKKRVAEIKKLLQSGDVEIMSLIVEKAQDLKGQAKIFGFGFIANICTQIINFSEIETKSLKIRLHIISKFVEALDLAMTHRLRDEDGKFERDLMLMVDSVLPS